MSPTRQYLQDWEKAEMDELEVFLAEGQFHCIPSVDVDDDVTEVSIEEDLIIDEVIPFACPPFTEPVFPDFP